MIYNRLFEWRQKADYEVLLKVDDIMARDLYKQTEGSRIRASSHSWLEAF